MQDSKGNTGLIVGIMGVTALLFIGLVYAVMRAPADPVGSTTTGNPETGLVFTDELHPFQGPENDQKVTVQIYGDFQCPACRAAEAFVKPTIERFRDLGVKFVWKDFPLPIHRNARKAASAARCAHEQGWFWSMHDKLFENQSSWSEERDPVPVFDRLAKTLSEKGPYDHTRWQECMKQDRFANMVQSDVDEAAKNRVDRTPTFFVGNRRIFPSSAEQFAGAIQAALDSVSSTTP